MKTIWKGEEKEISDEEEFQDKCVKLFSQGEGKIFLNYFNNLLKYHSIYDPAEEVYTAYYKEGYFGLIRDINLSLLKYTLKRKNEVKDGTDGK